MYALRGDTAGYPGGTIPPWAVIHILTVVPAFIVCGIGLLGFIQLLLGMRENQVINILILFALILPGLVFRRNPRARGQRSALQWRRLLFASAVALIVVIHWLAGFLDKEKDREVDTLTRQAGPQPIKRTPLHGKR